MKVLIREEINRDVTFEEKSSCTKFKAFGRRRTAKTASNLKSGMYYL